MGQGSVMFVSGESGIGKTALVQNFVDLVADETLVLWGMCDPLTTPRTLGALHDVEDLLGGQVHELLHRGAPSSEIFSAVFDQLQSKSSVMVVDDLQWADDGTIDLFRYLVRRIGMTSSLVIGMVRTDDVGQSRSLRRLLGDGARSTECTRVEVGPLSTSAIATMIGDRAIDPQSLHDMTGGNSFYVTEMLAHEGEDLPTSVREAILARATDLDPGARSLIDLLACAPEGIAHKVLPSLGIGIAPLRALDGVGLIRRTRRGVGFRHEICRLVFAEAIPPGGEVELHLRLLEALEKQPEPDPAVLVHHALALDDSPRVFRLGSWAGLVAARAGAHTEACAFFESALSEGGPFSEADEAELLERLAAERYLTDRLEDAIDACERALLLRRQLGDPASVSADHQALSVYHWYNANPVVALDHSAQAVEVVEGTSHQTHLAHALALQAYLALQRSDWQRATSLTAAARTTALTLDDAHLRVRLDLIDGLGEVVDGTPGARARLLALLESGSPHLKDVNSSGYSNLAYHDVEQRRFDQAAELLAVSLPLTIEPDIPICHVWQMGARSRLHLMRGAWDEAIIDANRVLDVRSAPLARTWPHIVRGLVRLRRGQPGADEDLGHAWRLATTFGEPLRLLPAASALVERAWLTGMGDSRVDEAVEMLGAVSSSDLRWSISELALWLRRIGHPGASEDGGPGEDAVAAEPADAQSAPYDRALMRYDSGEFDAAIQCLELLDSLGADAVATKVRQELRNQGFARVPSPKRASTRTNPAGLTTRQMEVLHLLGEGLTNAELAERLYISPKTADHHVSAILNKLDVASRRDAVRAGRRLGAL